MHLLIELTNSKEALLVYNLYGADNIQFNV